MNKLTLSALTLAILGTTSIAHAQSSVTLYGIVDTAVSYTHNNATPNGNASSKLSLNGNGNMSGDRFGVKGTEDLGGGLKTVFQLESGFDLSNGQLNQGGREFGRQAFVGLSSANSGTVTLGRQYDPVVDMIQPLTEDVHFGSIFGTPGDVDNYDDNFRVDNSIKYVSPSYNGLQMEGMYAMGGVAGQTSAGQSYSLAASYNRGGLGLALGYFNTKSSSSTVFQSTADTNADAGINSAFSTGAQSLGIGRVAAQYEFGAFTVGASYSNVQYRPLSDAGLFTSTETFNSGSTFLNYQLNPATLLGLGYTYMKSNGVTSATYNQVSLGSDYSLSKRTDLYAVFAYQSANGQTLSADGSSFVNASASIGSFGTPSGNSSQDMLMLGIRHQF